MMITSLKNSWNKFYMFIIIFSSFLSYQGFSPYLLNFTAHFCPEMSSVKILTIIPCFVRMKNRGEELEKFAKACFILASTINRLDFFLLKKMLEQLQKPQILKFQDLLKIVYNG